VLWRTSALIAAFGNYCGRAGGRWIQFLEGQGPHHIGGPLHRAWPKALRAQGRHPSECAPRAFVIAWSNQRSTRATSVSGRMSSSILFWSRLQTKWIAGSQLESGPIPTLGDAVVGFGTGGLLTPAGRVERKHTPRGTQTGLPPFFTPARGPLRSGAGPTIAIRRHFRLRTVTDSSRNRCPNGWGRVWKQR